MRFFLTKLLSATACILIVLSGCSDDDSVTPVLARIEIVSSIDSPMDINTTSVLKVVGYDQSDNSIEIQSEVQWSSSTANVSISQDGTIKAESVGTALIKAIVDGIASTLTITVWDSTAPRTEVYVSDAANFDTGPYKILKYDVNGENGSVFIDNQLQWPQDILFLEDQQIVLISNFSTKITKYNANSGQYIDDFAVVSGVPTRMKIGPDGLLYVLQWQGGNEKVMRFELDGTPLGAFTSIAVKESIGLDWDASGNLYVSSFNNGTGGSVRRFDPTGNDLGVFVSSPLQGPTNIWFDSSGHLNVNDWQAGRISRFDANGSFVGHLATGLGRVEGVDFFPNGDFLIGNGGSAEVKLFSSNGTFKSNFIRSGSGGLIWPNAVRIRHVN